MAIGLRERLDVKFFRVGDGEDKDGENLDMTRGDAVGEEDADKDVEPGMDSHNWSDKLGLLEVTSIDIES